MSALKKAPRIPDSDPINEGLLAMGFKRAKPTMAKKLPVNSWKYKIKNTAGVVIVKPNYRGLWVAHIIDHHNSRPDRPRYVAVPDEIYEDPLTLAIALKLAGDGCVQTGAYKLTFGRVFW